MQSTRERLTIRAGIIEHDGDRIYSKTRALVDGVERDNGSARPRILARFDRVARCPSGSDQLYAHRRADRYFTAADDRGPLHRARLGALYLAAPLALSGRVTDQDRGFRFHRFGVFQMGDSGLSPIASTALINHLE